MMNGFDIQFYFMILFVISFNTNQISLGKVQQCVRGKDFSLILHYKSVSGNKMKAYLHLILLEMQPVINLLNA